MRTYRTTLFMTMVGAAEHELELVFSYSVTPRSNDYWDGQQWQQGWSAEVDIQSAKIKVAPTEWVAMPEWMFGLFYADTDFQAELLRDADESDEYARDQKADADREERMLGRRR